MKRVDYNGFPVPSHCSDCYHRLELEVLKSAAGYYLGSWCECGPHSRESGYYSSEAFAGLALEIRFNTGK